MQTTARSCRPDAWGAAPIQSGTLSALPWLVHGFSTRKGGCTTAYGKADDLNLGFTAQDDAAVVLENRGRLIEALGFAPGELVTAKQVHSSRVVRIRREATPPGEADGLLTNEAGLLLGIQTADCVPVLVADPVTRSVGAFHAGWRGTAAGIVEQGIARMTAEFGSEPGDVVAAIGPSIAACCYRVGPEVAAAFRTAFAYGAALISADSRLDLKEANQRQLLASGVMARNIAVLPDCTSCNPDLYFSYRAQQGVTGRMLSVIGIRDQNPESGALYAAGSS